MLLVVSSVACLAIATPAVEAGDSFDGNYTGKRILTNVPADDCPAEENVSVTINGNVLTFADSALQITPLAFTLSRTGHSTSESLDGFALSLDIQSRLSLLVRADPQIRHQLPHQGVLRDHLTISYTAV
jgi:hypothetical protein